MILSTYLMRSYVMRFLLLMAGLVFFLQALDLLGQATDVLRGGGPPMMSLLRYVALRLPALIETVAPLAGLLGALTALIGMAKNSEILAMRAAGRSVFSLVGGLVVVGVLLSVLLFLFSNFIVTRTNAVLAQWKAADYRPDGQVLNEEPTWLMEAATVIRVGHVMREGAVLNDVTIFRPGPSGGIGDILTMRLAIWEDGHWSTFEVKRVAGDPEGGSASGQRTTASEAEALNDITPIWHTELRPESFVISANHPTALSIEALREYTGPESVGARPAYFYNTWLQQKIAGPIMLAVMPLLGAIAAFAHHRQGAAILTVIHGVTLGFMFVVIDNILLAMGQFGSLPPILSAWLPLVFFTVVGIWIVFRFEHTGART
jgi:lipopolysaccharide export system permease protein